MKQFTLSTLLVLFCGMLGFSQNWTIINSGINTTLTAVVYKDELTLFATGNDGKIYTSINGGFNWSVSYTGLSPLNCIASNQNNVQVAVGFDGIILRNEGAGWLTISSGTSYALSGVCFADAATGYAVGENGTILKTTNAGMTWIPVSLRTNDWLRGVNAYDPQHVAAVSENGGFFQTSNGGSSWTELSLPGNPFMSGVSMLGPNSGWICGTDGIMYYFDGTSLTLFPMGTTDGIMWMWIEDLFYDLFFGYGVGDWGHIWVFQNGQWVDQGSQIMEYLLFVMFWMIFSDDPAASDSVTLKACAVGTNGAVLLNSEVVTGVKDPPSGTTSSLVFPNPVKNGFCFIKGEIPADGILVQIVDLTGKTVHKQQILSPGTPIDLRSLRNGLYVARIQKGERFFSQKIILKSEL